MANYERKCEALTCFFGKNYGGVFWDRRQACVLKSRGQTNISAKPKNTQRSVHFTYRLMFINKLPGKKDISTLEDNFFFF